MKINNLKINKQKALPLFFAGVISLSLSGCGNNIVMGDTSLDELSNIEEVKELTLLDELEETDKGLTRGKQLENYLYLLDELKSYDFTGIDELRPLPEEEYKQLESMSLEEYGEILNEANLIDVDLVTMEKRLDAIKKLYYLNNYCKQWVENNGVEVVLELMKNSVKANAAVELNIPVEEFDSILIKERPSVNEINPKYIIIANDKEYAINPDDHAIWDTIDYIYKIQNPNLMSDEEKKKYMEDPTDAYKKAIDLSKITICSGSNLKDGNILESQNSKDYIKKFMI